MSFNFDSPSGSSSHNCIRMNGSRPFTVNFSHLFGFDKISLTLPCDKPITKSPKTRWGMFPLANFSRTCRAMSKVSRHLFSSYCWGVNPGRDFLISLLAIIAGDNGDMLLMLKFVGCSSSGTVSLRYSVCCCTIVTVGVTGEAEVDRTGDDGSTMRVEPATLIGFFIGTFGDCTVMVALLSTICLCSISSLAKARMLFTASSVEGL